MISWRDLFGASVRSSIVPRTRRLPASTQSWSRSSNGTSAWPAPPARRGRRGSSRRSRPRSAPGPRRPSSGAQPPAAISSKLNAHDSLIFHDLPVPSVNVWSRSAARLLPVFFASVRPAHVEAIDDRRPVEPEMDAQIVLRQVTAAAANFLPLLGPAGDEVDARADRVAIRRGADQLQVDPVMRGIAGEAVQVGTIVDVGDRDVDLPVVVDVAERGAAGGLRDRQRGADAGGQILEPAVTAGSGRAPWAARSRLPTSPGAPRDRRGRS